MMFPQRDAASNEHETPAQAAAAIVPALDFLAQEALRAGLNDLAATIGVAAQAAAKDAAS